MSELETFEDDGIHEENSGKKRPTFVTVLAILSWVYVGLGLLSGIYTSLLSSTEAQMEKLDDTIEIYEEMDRDVMPMADDMISFLEASKENFKINNLIQLILLLIEGVGVFLMFNLRRKGYWIYALSQLGILILPLITFPADNIITIISVAFNGLIIGVFMLLYGLNLKHMH